MPLESSLTKQYSHAAPKLRLLLAWQRLIGFLVELQDSPWRSWSGWLLVSTVCLLAMEFVHESLDFYKLCELYDSIGSVHFAAYVLLQFSKILAIL